MVAIITLTLSSTLLIACLAIATLNVVLRRESTNFIEKQISPLVESSRSIAPAILDRAGTCGVQGVNSGDLKPLVQYAQGAFPQARISLAVDFRKDSPSLVPEEGLTDVDLPNWLPDSGFTGIVVDHGQIEIRNIAALEEGACRVAAIFRMPLGSELAKRLSLGGNSDVITVPPRQFYVGGLSHKILGMIEMNFLPGSPRPASVVLNVRNWETGAMEHWTAYEVRTSYSRTFRDLATIGSQLANWVWLLAAISFVALLIDASALWIGVWLSRDIAMAIDDLCGAAQQIARGNFAWRTPLRSNDQIGELTGSFNEMAASLEQFQKQEVTRLEFESDLRMAQRVQEYLFPRQAPVVSGATVAGRTLPARTVGGDLYDFFDLGQKQLGVLCADVSGKGVSAALMMANLQAVAHAHVGASPDGSAQPPAPFVQRLNDAFVGRFGNNRYATLFWAEYDSQTRVLKYVNAGHEPPILIGPTGEIERLETSGFPIGMFGKAGYDSTALRVEAGSRIVIFTDGLADAQTPSGEEFGDERVIDCCRGLTGALSAEQLVERLMQAAASWSAGAEHFDDTTVVAVAVTP
ncbi:MAG TPA: SpoIIE family protein phosphatase [Bryobacteraceae bacterium]|nr:SpoIIE family protein phosphatase [Bryobacteraceae bacterium]